MINNKLEKIYTKYHPDGKVIGGGVLAEDSYINSKAKMLFLMKEANDPTGNNDWSLPDLLKGIQAGGKEPPFYRMWKNVSRWALATQYMDISFEDIKKEELLQGLNYFATTNLKKTAGSGQSDYAEIFNAAESNKLEWLEEINILEPNLIVCAGTFDIVKDILEMNNQVKICKAGARYFIQDETLFLDFVHPAYQVSDKLMFAYFKETYHSLLKENCFINNK